jgi:hypothetical protein
MRCADIPTKTLFEGTPYQVTGNFSLLSEWTEYVNRLLRTYVDWPIVTLKMDDLFDVYQARVQRDECGIQVTTLQKDDLYAIEVTSRQTCRAVVSLPRGTTYTVAPSMAKIVQDTLGKEPLALWIDMTPTVPVTLYLNTPVVLSRDNV